MPGRVLTVANGDGLGPPRWLSTASDDQSRGGPIGIHDVDPRGTPERRERNHASVRRCGRLEILLGAVRQTTQGESARIERKDFVAGPLVHITAEDNLSGRGP